MVDVFYYMSILTLTLSYIHKITLKKGYFYSIESIGKRVLEVPLFYFLTDLLDINDSI